MPSPSQLLAPINFEIYAPYSSYPPTLRSQRHPGSTLLPKRHSTKTVAANGDTRTHTHTHTTPHEQGDKNTRTVVNHDWDPTHYPPNVLPQLQGTQATQPSKHRHVHSTTHITSTLSPPGLDETRSNDILTLARRHHYTYLGFTTLAHPLCAATRTPGDTQDYGLSEDIIKIRRVTHTPHVQNSSTWKMQGQRYTKKTNTSHATNASRKRRTIG